MIAIPYRRPVPMAARLVVTHEDMSIIRAALDTYYMQQLADPTDNPAIRARLLKTGEMLKQLPNECPPPCAR